MIKLFSYGFIFSLFGLSAGLLSYNTYASSLDTGVYTITFCLVPPATPQANVCTGKNCSLVGASTGIVSNLIPEDNVSVSAAVSDAVSKASMSQDHCSSVKFTADSLPPKMQIPKDFFKVVTAGNYKLEGYNSASVSCDRSREFTLTSATLSIPIVAGIEPTLKVYGASFENQCSY